MNLLERLKTLPEEIESYIHDFCCPRTLFPEQRLAWWSSLSDSLERIKNGYAHYLFNGRNRDVNYCKHWEPPPSPHIHCAVNYEDEYNLGKCQATLKKSGKPCTKKAVYWRDEPELKVCRQHFAHFGTAVKTNKQCQARFLNGSMLYPHYLPNMNKGTQCTNKAKYKINRSNKPGHSSTFVCGLHPYWLPFWDPDEHERFRDFKAKSYENFMMMRMRISNRNGGSM